jgi:hypothetical protein
MEPRYRLGEDISFNDACDSRLFMGSGRSHTEDWGVWTIGREATLRLRFDERPNESLTLNAFVTPLLTPQHDRLSVRVMCNESLAMEWVFTLTGNGGWSPRWCVAELPQRLVGGDELRISFLVDAPASPLALGLSGDPRELGLGFLKLSLSAARAACPQERSQ